MNLFGKAKSKPQAADTTGTILKLRETLDSLDKRCVWLGRGTTAEDTVGRKVT